MTAINRTFNPQPKPTKAQKPPRKSMKSKRAKSAIVRDESGFAAGRSQPIISDELRNAAKGQECTLKTSKCNHDWSTTVHCHARFFTMAGIAQKPNDIFGFHACAACHANEDESGFDDILRALMTTQQRLCDAGIILVVGSGQMAWSM